MKVLSVLTVLLSTIVISTVLESEFPAAQFSVVSTAVKSPGEDAVPAVEVTFTLAVADASPVRATEMVRVDVFSATDAVLTVKFSSPA